jgi:hypothetical protein
MGGFDGYDFTISFFRDNLIYSNDPSESPNVDREILAEVILSSAALKEITRWLLLNVNDIEEKNGVIREPLLKTETKRHDDNARKEFRVLAAYS